MTIFFAFFPRIFECDKPQETIYKRPEAFLTFTVELMTAFFKGFKSLLKTQVFEKKATFPVKRKFGPFFLRLSSTTNLNKQFIRVHRLFWKLQWNL